MLALAGAEAASPTSVPTIADLRALPRPTGPDVVAVAGHSAPGDGGGGSFRFDPLSWARDNDGTIVAPAVDGRGRWIRVYDRDLSVKWFGAKGDGRSLDTARIQAAVDAVRPGDTLHFPAGVYRIEADRGVRMKSDVRLDLGEATLAGANVAGARCRLIGIEGASNIVISGGTLVGSRTGAPEWGVGILASDARNLFIQGVSLRSFYYDGILLTGNEGCRHVVIRDVAALNNRRSGLSVVSGSDISVSGSTFQGSNGQSPEAGVNVEPAGAAVQQVRFESCAFRRNAGNGLYLHAGHGGTLAGALVVDSLVESNGYGIVAADTSQLTISRNRVTGHTGPARSGIVVARGREIVISDNELAGNRRGVLSADATGVEIRGNTVVGTGPDPGGGADAGEDGEGIACRGVHSPVAGACVVDGNRVSRSAGAGILTLLVSHVRVANNIVDEAGQRGIQLRYTSRSEVLRNMVAGNGQEAKDRYDAIELSQFSDANVVTQNVIRLGASGRNAVTLSADSRGNRVYANVVLP